MPIIKIADEDVRSLIEELPMSYRLIMVLTRIEGFTCEEISSLTGLPSRVVANTIGRGNMLMEWKHLNLRQLDASSC
jgi:DNA-directed RNA polymerase specialized sigma24 family protein